MRGVTVIEILVVIFILSIAFVGILGLLTFSLQVSNLNKETIYANFLAKEAIEAIRNFRDGTDWNINGLGNLTIGIAYHPEKTIDSPPKWQMVQGEEVIGNFTRRVIFATVFRDSNDNIVESGGILDPDTKKVKVTVSWEDKEAEIVTYLTNWR